ncbi:MAG: OmpH family outer membrane protein [Bacteroidales bacterium]|nr:OmpH family outer membrane protein [Bacteroidales bacterium]
MKKYLITLVLFALASTSLSVNAQSKTKLAHINSQELLEAMPATDSARAQLEKIAREHEAVLEEMYVEYQTKASALGSAMEAGNLSDLALASKQSELKDIENRITTFEQTARQDIEKKQVELFTPVQEAAMNAVNLVAEENGITYVFDTSMGTLVYMSPDALNILPLVKAKLGVE